MSRVYIAKVASSARTISAHLKWLIDESYIVRKFRHSSSNPKWKLASDFIILHWDEDSEVSGMVQKIAVPTEENCREDSQEILRERARI